MNTIISITFAIAGILFLVYYRTIARCLSTFFAKRFHESYGDYATERGWDNPNSAYNKWFYTAAALFLGIFLLIVAFHELFGTIHLGTAAQQEESALQV